MVKKVKRLLGLALGCLVLFCVYCGFSIWEFSLKSPQVRADAAIVLGAAAWGSKPSPVLEGRIRHAVRLWEEESVDTIIFTGGKGKDGESPWAESEVAQRYARHQGVDPEDILIETRSRVTRENLKYAKKIGEDNGLRTFVIVSDPLHMRRAVTIAEDLRMDVVASPASTSAYESLQTRIPFFLREWALYIGYLLEQHFLLIRNVG